VTTQPFDRFATNHFFKFLTPVVAAVMDHPVRRRLNDPVKTLEATGLQPGQCVLEVGCGTGFFTIPAARLVGDTGLVHSIDLYPRAIEHVTQKTQEAVLTNVKLTLADALATGLPDSGFDLILLLGVIPSPTLPLDRLLPEMHRLLKPNGELAVWTVFPWGLCASVNRSGLFVHIGKESGVHRFKKQNTAGR
jgi:demethylmenaquinone methyltransferase/2-methoxy-6-polyprenyl-1,4-benzoquinol methylase